ncbi:NADH dehydrogenase [Limnochorda pilosa]|uniref:NADH dehydrogenase n=1 Tax=Limnochorda pilosa TaxID=1555112 RepID=A0A0K2SI20_LIMPI|nr:NADH dehydrogenase [Limnochorda pilosa]
MVPLPVRRAEPGRDTPAAGRSSIIVLLQQVQEQHGYLPRPEVVRCAGEAGISVAQAYGVASFYNFFKLTPPGQHTIRICQGTACHVQGAQGLLERVQSELGIQPGETTPDGLFSLETVACLGACSMSPAVVIDGEVFGRVTSRQVPRILARYRRRK